MSFLEQLNNKRNTLKRSDTVVTLPDGRRFIEKKDDVNVLIDPKTFGFVVDTKPDNIPAEIIEHVYLGSQDCCTIDILQKFNIVRVLSIGVEAPCIYANVTYKFVQCLDLPETNVHKILMDTCISFILDAIEHECNILIHCNAGVSRSAAVVIGFLILVQKLSFKDAFHIVKTARSCIKPNSGFEKQLRLMEL